jgi:predicted enzyme related to lactoylglutathione lyase
MSRVVHFEIHAEDPERAIRFYTGTLGWNFSKFPYSEEYWVIKTGPDDQPGIDGGMIRRRGTIDGQAVIAYVCTVKVQSVDDAVAKATENGGVNVVPKMPIPGVGYLAYCKDTEGNIFGLMNDDPGAA